MDKVVDPNSRKLDPHWNGRWSVKSVKMLFTMEIANGVKTKVVHINYLRERIVSYSTQIWRNPVVMCHSNHITTGKHLKSAMWEYHPTQFDIQYRMSIRM